MRKVLKLKLFFIIGIILFASIFSGCSSEYYLNQMSDKLSNYQIDASLDAENHKVTVSQTVEYRNNSTVALNNLKFNLFVKAFSQGATNKPVSTLNTEKAYPNGLSYGDIVFSSITSNNKPVTYTFEELDKNILNIALLEELKRGYRVFIEMEYEITLPNINHRFGYGNNAINLGNFYPIACVIEGGEFVIQPYSSNGDPFYSDLANYTVNFSHPNSYVMANTGKVTKKEVLEDTTKTTIKAKTVRDFCVVLSDKFAVKTENSKNTQINYYFYADENSQTSLKTAKRALETFRDLIGEYPYETLNVVQTNFVHGGMEYPNLVYVSDNLTNYEDYTNVIIHEIAHQWWYGIVGNNAYKYGWLDEGLTEYSTAVFYELNPEYNIKKEEVMKNAMSAYNMFQDVYSEIFGTVDTSLARTLSEYKTEPEYVYMAYVKAMILMDELRSLVGDKKFFKALKYYYKENRFQNVTPKEFVSAMEKSTGRSLNGWFNSWIEGRVIIKDLS